MVESMKVNLRREYSSCFSLTFPLMGAVSTDKPYENGAPGIKLLLSILTASLLFASSPSFADCTISASSFGFGLYVSNQAAAINSTSTITVNCDNGTNYSISFDNGQNYSSTRRMADGSSHYLSYSLFRDSGHTLNWGSNKSVDTKNGTGSGANQLHTVYGFLPGSQNVPPGNYSDSIIATIEW